MKYKAFFAISSIFLFIFSFSPVFSATFIRNLRQGDQGQDVLALQKILNTSSATQIADIGAGSPGQETTYFGQKTALAVIKFQKIYNISPAAGFVGPITRAKLESMVNFLNSHAPVPTPTTAVIAVPTPDPSSPVKAVDSLGFYQQHANKSDKSPTIFEISANEVAPGGTLLLYGANFDLVPNDIHVGSSTVLHLPASLSSSTLPITIPSDIALARYEVWMTNVNGSSNVGTSTFKLRQYIQIVNDPLPKPIVTDSVPRVVKPGDLLTIHGSDFTPTGNAVYSGLGSIKDIPSSDGTSISIHVQDFSGFSGLDLAKFKGNQVPLTFGVVNKGGISNQMGAFIIQF